MSRKCSKCKTDRPLNQFPRDKQRPDGVYPICKVCRATYYQNNRDWILRQYREYRTAHAHILLPRARAYAEKRFFYKTAGNLLNRIPAGERTGIRKMCAEVSRLWKQQRGRCVVTGRRLNRENAQLDHIVPLVRGGVSTIDNLRWVHRDVNYAKRDLLDEDFFRLCEDVINFRTR